MRNLDDICLLVFHGLSFINTHLRNTHVNMALNIGQVLKGRAAFYHVTKVLKDPTVFQAKIVPFEGTQSIKQATQLCSLQFSAYMSNQADDI